MASARTPIFRHFPRVGIPPHYGSWEIFSRRVELMMNAGAIPDYTYLWWDVRPHPNLGTVEVRAYDQQTRLEDTVALAALAICLVHRYAANFDDEKPLIEVPTELIDDNKVRAALRGIEGELVDLPRDRQRARQGAGRRDDRGAGARRSRARLRERLRRPQRADRGRQRRPAPAAGSRRERHDGGPGQAPLRANKRLALLFSQLDA